MTELTARELLIMLYEAALDSVDGRFLVHQWCRDNQEKISQEGPYTHCIAVGKVAAPMLQGALDNLPSIKKSLLICPQSKITRQLKKNENIICVASSHPVPDEASIKAGNVLISFLEGRNKHDKILFLISGGTSALVEVPARGVTLETLQKVNQYLLASGKNIHQINAWRQQFSVIKGGGLLNWIDVSSVTQLLLSDVKDDKSEFIGSGLLVNKHTPVDADEYLSSLLVSDLKTIEENTTSLEKNINTYVIGNINMAKQAVSDAAKAEGLKTFVYDEFLEGDVGELAEKLFMQLTKAESGIHIWGGESTVRLPEKPGIGGRNQTLALAFAKYISEVPDLHLLSAGTDGIDGNSNCAGAMVSHYTAKKAAKMGFDIDEEIQKANAGVLLMATDDLVKANSNTNVMDIIIAYKM